MTANKSLLKWAVRLLLTWLVLSAIGVFVGQAMIEFLRPGLKAVTQGITDDFYAQLSWDTKDPQMLLITAEFGIPKPEIQAMGINPGATVTAGTNVEHVLVPVVLLFTVLVCWPVASFRHRLILLALGVPGALLALGLTTPFLLAGKVESLLQEYAAGAGLERPEPLFLKWMLFTEVGGRWLVPIVIGLGCVWLLHWLFVSKPDDGAGVPVNT